MKRYWHKLAWLLLLIMLAVAWLGWQAGGMQLLQPGLAWC
jgi:hypothetical protein